MDYFFLFFLSWGSKTQPNYGILPAKSQSKPDSKRKQKRDLYQSFQPEVTNVTFVTVTIGHNRSHCLKSVAPVFKSFFQQNGFGHNRSQSVTIGHIPQGTPFCFRVLFGNRLDQNEIQQNRLESDLCFRFLFGIRLRPALRLLETAQEASTILPIPTPTLFRWQLFLDFCDFFFKNRKQRNT